MKYPRTFLFLVALFLSPETHSQEAAKKRTFGVWATSCSHVPADIRKGRESLALAIRHSEGQIEDAPGFNWDVMIDAGDLSADQHPPGDKDGMELLRQYRALTKHRREQVYNVQGNHDAPYYDHGPGSWFRKWGDPIGEFTEYSGVDPDRRPYPVEGTWERYRFTAGNLLFLMLADRNDAPSPVGRGHSKTHFRGGYPPGAVTRKTFEWWKKQVLANQDKIIITMHHHALRDTTTASGNGEGNPRYHGASGGAAGSSYLYFLIENDDPDDFQFTSDAHVFEDFLDDFHKKNGTGAIDFWIGGHTHVKGPDDDFGGKTITESKWGVNFLQSAALTKHHAGSHPLSRLLTFTEGQDNVEVATYLHDTYQKHSVGFYKPADRQLPLRHNFSAPPPIVEMEPFPAQAKIFPVKYPVSRPSASMTFPAKTGPELWGNWKVESGGKIDLESQIAADHKSNHIPHKPEWLKAKNGTHYLKFSGQSRIRIGQLDMENWTGLTFSTWIKPEDTGSIQRIISKDDLGTPGNFVLFKSGSGSWSFRVWDDRKNAWSVATAHQNLSDGKWHHVAGVADSADHKIRLYFDGKPVAEADWTAETLDDSDGTDLVIGADSGKRKFGNCFQGSIRGVELFPRTLTEDEIHAKAAVRR